MTKPRVLLADDHKLVVEGFKKLLENQCELVGIVDNGRDLLEAAVRLQPDLVILDISMPLLNGLDAARQLQKLLPGGKLIFVTMHGDATYAKAAFQAGASGYLLKRSAPDELNHAIQSVLQGNYYVSPLITKDVIQFLLDRSSEPACDGEELTFRQREILQLLTEGHSVKEIAKVLKISPRTVESHKAHFMEQLDLHTTAELIKYALTHGLISTE